MKVSVFFDFFVNSHIAVAVKGVVEGIDLHVGNQSVPPDVQVLEGLEVNRFDLIVRHINMHLSAKCD